VHLELLTDLKETDEVSIVCMHQLDAFVFVEKPPFFALVQTLGLAIGVNGKKYNEVTTESNIYCDNRYVTTLTCNHTSTNIIRVSPGDTVTPLVYFFNAKYLSAPPIRDVPEKTPKNKTPPPGSSETLTATMSIFLEFIDKVEGSLSTKVVPAPPSPNVPLRNLQSSMNSAQLTAPKPYAIPSAFHPGEEKMIEIPVLGGKASALEHFVVDGNGNLQYTGKSKAVIRVNALFSFGSLKPSQSDPEAKLDHGPKATMWFYLTVGKQKGQPVRMDQTIYLPAYEWPVTRYNIDFADAFVFSPGDSVKCWAYYTFNTKPEKPLDPDTFYVNIMLAATSLPSLATTPPPTSFECPLETP
jgi:hypothetical protein